jgi:hypothetical protein
MTAEAAMQLRGWSWVNPNVYHHFHQRRTAAIPSDQEYD